MSALTKPQLILGEDNQPLYAVVPYDEYLALTVDDDKVTLPHEVAMSIAVDGLSPLKAWRLFRAHSQQQMADKLNITQGAVAQAEKKDKKNQNSTLQEWAAVLKCKVSQLT